MDKNKVNIEKITSKSEFWLGNPQVEIIEGSIEYQEIQFILDDTKTNNFHDGELEIIKQNLWEINMKNDIIKSKDLLCTNLTNKFSILEFLEYIKIYISYIDQIRIFTSPTPNVYFLYLQFKNLEYSNIFYNTFNYSKINPLDKDYLIFAEIISMSKKESFINNSNTAKEHITMNFNSISSTPKNKISEKKKVNILEIENNVTQQNIKGVSPFRKNNMELRSSINSIEEARLCPICLDSLEPNKANEISIGFHNQINGIIYVLCGHTFHIDCLLRLDDEKCPLCRFDLSPANVNTCSLCSQSKDLWMCIICGNINCGDLGESSNHREQHYANTGHIYARGLLDYNVTYDFSRKVTLNRWFQTVLLSGNNNIDSNSNINSTFTLEEETKTNNSNFIKEDDFQSENHVMSNENINEFAKNPKEKVEFILSEYNSIISSQLESQRTYYISYINKIEETLYDEFNKLDTEIKELEDKTNFSLKEKSSSDYERKTMEAIFKTTLHEEKDAEELNKKKEKEFKELIFKKNKLEESLNSSKNKELLMIKEIDSEISAIDEEITESLNHIKTMNEISKRKDAGDLQGSSLRIINMDKKGKKKK